MKSICKKLGGWTSVCLFLAVALLSACTTPEAKLNEVVKQLNAECPIGFGISGELSKATVEEETVSIYLKMNESFVNLDALNANPAVLKTNLKAMFQNPKEDVRKLLELMTICEKDLRCVYEGSDSDKSASATLTVEDMQELLTTKVDVAARNAVRLEESVRISNLSCPMDLGGGLVMERLLIEDENVAYEYSVDEEQTSIGQMKANDAVIKQNIRNSLSANDPALRQFVQMCVDCNKGIHYRYIGTTSGDVFEVSFEVSELQ